MLLEELQQSNLTTRRPSVPTIQGDSVTIPEGWGYWALGFYPWGGSFHRLAKDYTGTIARILEKYNDGSVKRFVVILPDGIEAGFQR